MQPTGFATSADGTKLAVYVTENSDASTTVLAVHGYPDNACVWDAVTALLAPDHRVLRYDVRGTGRSDKPADRFAYRLERLTEDALAVLTEFSPDRDVHLLGHDWGSVQGWHFAADESLATRLTGFTSVSGPSVTYLRPWLRTRWAARNWRPALRQLLHSSYIAFFKLPLLPELAWRSGIGDRVLAWSEPVTERSMADKVNGLQLYRANLLTRDGPRARPVRLPVQLIVPTRDRYISVDFAVETPRPFVTDLTVLKVDAGHWLPLVDPGFLARAVTEFVRR